MARVPLRGRAAVVAAASACRHEKEAKGTRYGSTKRVVNGARDQWTLCHLAEALSGGGRGQRPPAWSRARSSEKPCLCRSSTARYGTCVDLRLAGGPNCAGQK